MATTADQEHGEHEQDHGERDLERGEWRLLAILGLPTFAYALATTIATTYLPVLASDFVGSTTVVGLLIAVEGIMALLLAVPAGAISDRRSRLPFVLGATPVLVLALAAMGFVTSLGLAILATTFFFAAYFIAYEPYRSLYPDLLDDEIAARGQSTQAIWRGIGTIVAIGAGGVLLSVSNAVPFVAGAAVTAIAIVVFVVLVPRDRDRGGGDDVDGHGVRGDLGRLRELLRERGDIRAFMVANSLWELALGAIKTFIILYLTKGLGITTSESALAVAATAVFIGAAAPLSGKLGDRFGTIPVLRISLTIYGLGLLVPLIATTPLVVGLVAPLIAFGGGVVMTLPYALLIPLMDEGDHGLTTGLYSVSRGIGTALGPLLAGVAIQVFAGPLDATQGYQAMWAVAAVAILASVPILGRLRERADANGEAHN